MSMFAKIAGASASGGGNIIRDGMYKLLVESVSLEKKHTGEVFIAELRVIEASPTGDTDERGNQIMPNKVGSTASLVCNLTKHESAAGNAKAFVCAVLGALGYTEEQITSEVMVEVCDKVKNPLRGIAVGDNTFRGVNKGRANPANIGKPLTLNKWYSIPQTADSIKAQRAYLDTNKASSDAQPAAATMPAAVNTTAAAAPTPTPAPAAQPAAAPTGGILGGLGLS